MRKAGRIVSALVAFVWVAAAVGHGQTVLTHHMRPATQNGGARFVSHLPATQTLRMVITLPLRNQDELENFLQEVYDPNSPAYRQFLTVDEFTAEYGPTQDDYDTVVGFAKASGLAVVGTSRNRLNVDVEGTVESVEKAFHLTLGVYQHPTENRTFYAPDREPTVDLPISLWHISGLDNYSLPHPAGLQQNLRLPRPAPPPAPARQRLSWAATCGRPTTAERR